MTEYGRPRVLIIAYACEPGKGSEQGVGWNWSLQLAKFAEVVVVTRLNNREVIERETRQRQRPNLEFVYYDPPAWLTRFKKGDRALYLFYLIWQWGSYGLGKQLMGKHAFTHVIQLTFGSIWMPVFAHRLGGTFVWGPIGGGEGIPAHLMTQVSFRAWLVQIFRRALIATLPMNPMISPALKRASHILVRTEDTMRILPVGYQSKAACVLETGVDSITLDALSQRSKRQVPAVPTLLFTGRLVGFKNVEMLLHAAAIAHKGGTRFRVRLVGDGPERKRLKALAARLGIAATVDFVGTVPRSQVLHELRTADIYAFPSLREGGPWSLMEAMCAALPIICINTSGMSIVTDEDCAIRIAPTSRDEIIREMAAAIVRLCASPDLRIRLGRNARQRMQDAFLWERKGEELARLLFGKNGRGAVP